MCRKVMFLFIWVNYLNVFDRFCFFGTFCLFARSSLQRSSKHHILTPQALFEWAKNNCKETEIVFSSKECYPIATEILKGQFDQAVTIPGTLQYHAFITTQHRKFLMKKFSCSQKYDIYPRGEKKKPQKRPAKLPTKAKKIAKKHKSTK